MGEIVQHTTLSCGLSGKESFMDLLYSLRLKLSIKFAYDWRRLNDGSNNFNFWNQLRPDHIAAQSHTLFELRITRLDTTKISHQIIDFSRALDQEDNLNVGLFRDFSIG